MYKNVSSDQSRWTAIYMQMREDKLEFFLNTQLEPTVLIPRASAH